MYKRLAAQRKLLKYTHITVTMANGAVFHLVYV